RMKLREEQLNVQKQPVEAGEARLRKDVVSEQQSVDVPVTHEEVYVERRPGSGQASDTPIGEGETYRVPVREEQVTASKQTVETGEVAIGKRQFQDTQRVSDTVNREEAHLESSGDVNVRNRGTEENLDQSDQTDL
ncbi:MAG TPA: YsnF/AvaK domain-containing protein, partial [Ktedonobacteraceae bacterium]|nr:YsnF/AvaK domain-containing protein [Ktedonobacteraceae bacterium]